MPLLSDNYPGSIGYAAFDSTPIWRYIDELPPHGHPRPWLVALAHQDLKAGDRQRPALMALAFVTASGWTLDGWGQIPLHFSPNWFCESPMDPPWPPPGVPMPPQPEDAQ